MKNFGLFLALALVIGGMSLTSCSSKENRSDEPVISSSTGEAAPAETANLGSSSSGQGR